MIKTPPGRGLLPRYPLNNLPKSPHRIEDIQDRKEYPESNFILCDCGWRGQPAEFPAHRKEMIVRKIDERTR